MSIRYISVIIPVYNAIRHVQKTLTALEEQEYDRDKYEVIVVDNGSTDNSIELIREFEGVRLFENTRSKNPYVSRNIGVEHSKGDIIAFLDITCTPSAKWLKEAVNMIQDGADLVGGKIEYTFSENPALGEWYDSITFVDVKGYIQKFGGTVGGNLFLKRKVWKALGPFPENGRSGMDIYWTRQATDLGFELRYCEQAVVYYPARSFRGVAVKSFRVGRGHAAAWKKEGRPLPGNWLKILKTFSPPSVSDIRKRIRERGSPEMEDRILALWAVSWFCKIMMAIGRGAGMLAVERNVKTKVNIQNG